MTLDCSHAYLDNPRRAQELGIDCVAVPRKTFPGVVVVKIQLFPGKLLKISDPYGALIMHMSPVADMNRDLALFLARANITDDRGFGYFDADMSQEGRLVIYLDHNWRCTW
jgi:hypothetical protein